MTDARATRERLASDLRALGVREGGVLLVHSSLSALGWVPGGPETVIQGLLTALGPEGTLLVPALSFATVTPEQPVFDVRTTPSCIGAIAEHFRTRPGSLRSVHPSHSVCGVGPRAHELLANHDVDRTPVGPNSPFRRLRAVGAGGAVGDAGGSCPVRRGLDRAGLRCQGGRGNPRHAGDSGGH